MSCQQSTPLPVHPSSVEQVPLLCSSCKCCYHVWHFVVQCMSPQHVMWSLPPMALLGRSGRGCTVAMGRRRPLGRASHHAARLLRDENPAANDDWLDVNQALLARLSRTLTVALACSTRYVRARPSVGGSQQYLLRASKLRSCRSTVALPCIQLHSDRSLRAWRGAARIITESIAIA